MLRSSTLEPNSITEPLSASETDKASVKSDTESVKSNVSHSSWFAWFFDQVKENDKPNTNTNETESEHYTYEELF